MGLLSSYGDFNKVTDEGLLIRYQLMSGSQYILSAGSSTPVTMYDWNVRRIANKRYRYVGMTYDAAKQCAQDKIQKYTRPKAVWYPSTTHPEPLSATANEYQADIRVIHDEGCMYHTEIVVNEEDKVHAFGQSTTVPALSSLFTSISCDYDE